MRAAFGALAFADAHSPWASSPHRCLAVSPHAQESQWPKFAAKMEGRSEAAIGAFKRNYDQLVAGVTGLVRFLLLRGSEQSAAWGNHPPELTFDRTLTQTKVPESEIDAVQDLPSLVNLPRDANADVKVRGRRRRRRRRSAPAAAATRRAAAAAACICNRASVVSRAPKHALSPSKPFLQTPKLKQPYTNRRC